jgi:hypothetical protein
VFVLLISGIAVTLIWSLDIFQKTIYSYLAPSSVLQEALTSDSFYFLIFLFMELERIGLRIILRALMKNKQTLIAILICQYCATLPLTYIYLFL